MLARCRLRALTRMDMRPPHMHRPRLVDLSPERRPPSEMSELHPSCLYATPAEVHRESHPSSMPSSNAVPPLFAGLVTFGGGPRGIAGGPRVMGGGPRVLGGDQEAVKRRRTSVSSTNAVAGLLALGTTNSEQPSPTEIPAADAPKFNPARRRGAPRSSYSTGSASAIARAEAGTATSTSFLTIFCAFPSSASPPTRCVLCSTWCPC